MHTISDTTMAIVKATAPALEKHGVALTQRMYERLFRDESVKAMFDQREFETGAQPRRLASAILAYARNIDRIDLLQDALARMSDKHVMSGVHPHHYPLVAEALLPAIRDILGEEVATDAVLAAWGEAYWVLAELLIGREADLYRRAA